MQARALATPPPERGKRATPPRRAVADEAVGGGKAPALHRAQALPPALGPGRALALQQGLGQALVLALALVLASVFWLPFG